MAPWAPFLKERSHSSSPTSRGRRACCTSSARRTTPKRSPSIGGSSGTPRPRTAESRSTRRATRSSSSFQQPEEPRPPHRRRATAAGPARCACAWAFTPASRRATPEGYVGLDVHRGARIAALAHGEQILVSPTTAALLEAEPLRDLGLHRLKDFDGAVHLYQLGEREFPPLRSPGSVELPIRRRGSSAASRSCSTPSRWSTSEIRESSRWSAPGDRQDAVCDRACAPAR